MRGCSPSCASRSSSRPRLSDLLSVISSSPGDLEPMFRTMLENGTRICQAQFGVLSLRDGAAMRVVAMHNPPPAYAELRRREPTWTPTGLMGISRRKQSPLNKRFKCRISPHTSTMIR